MSWYPDLGTATMVATGDHVRAIGWLSDHKPFPRGDASLEFLSRLDEFVRLASASGGALSFVGFGGVHVCELCDKPANSRDSLR